MESPLAKPKQGHDAELVDELLRLGRQVHLQVAGWSMSPLMPRGSEITVEPAVAGDVRVGDVVVVGTPKGIVTHRVVRTDSASGRPITRGDRSPAEDPDHPGRRILGKVRRVRHGPLSWAPGGRVPRLLARLQVAVVDLRNQAVTLLP